MWEVDRGETESDEISNDRPGRGLFCVSVSGFFPRSWKALMALVGPSMEGEWLGESRPPMRFIYAFSILERRFISIELSVV